MKEFSLNLTTDIAGNSINISGCTFGKGSPRVYIQGGAHGGEVTFWIFKKLFKYLSQSNIEGTVTLVPVSNPVSWSQRVYFYTTGKFSLQTGEDWNRGFPGAKTSLARRRADKLFEFATTYDYVIDLHTSRKSVPFGIFTKETLDTNITMALGLKYNYLLSNTADDSMMSALSRTSTYGFEVECGSHDSLEEQNIQTVYEGLLRFLARIRVTSLGTPSKGFSKGVFAFDTYRKYFANETGFCAPNKAIGEDYSLGEPLFKICDPTRLRREVSYSANEAGVVIKQIPSTIIWEGDEVLQSVPRDNLRKL